MIRRTWQVCVQLVHQQGSLKRRHLSSEAPAAFLRKMVPLEGSQGKGNLRALQYNVLAPEFGFGKYTEYCPLEAMDWAFRSQLLMQEVRHYNPDVLFMQEVEDFDNNFQEQFGKLGYVGKFKSTTDTSNKVGVAVMYREQRFEPLEELEIEFNDLSDDFSWEKDNVATAVLLRQKSDGAKLCLATAHIFWNPRRPDIKMMQSHYLCEKIEAFLKADTPAFNEIPLLLAGDFNSKPSSQVYQFLSEGFIERPEGLATKPRLDHNLSLASAFVSVGEPATNFTMDFQGCLDYIWHTRHFQPTSLIEAVQAGNKDLFSEIRFLPNKRLPSDHTCLVADFAMTSK